MRKGAAEVEAAEVEAAQVEPLAQVPAAQAREQAQQAEAVRVRRPEGRNKDQAREALAREEGLRTLAGRAIPQTRQTGGFRDGLPHKIRLQYRERGGSTQARRN